MNLSKRTIIIIGIVAAVLMLSSIIFVANRKPPVVTQDVEGYKDPISGETIKSDKDSQVPEDAKKDYVLFAGFSILIDRGLSPAQVQSIEDTIKAYSVEKDKKFKEVSLDVNSMQRILPKGTSRTHSLNFNIVVNRSDKYYITTAYENTDTIRTKLYAADKKTLLFEQ